MDFPTRSAIVVIETVAVQNGATVLQVHHIDFICQIKPNHRYITIFTAYHPFEMGPVFAEGGIRYKPSAAIKKKWLWVCLTGGLQLHKIIQKCPIERFRNA